MCAMMLAHTDRPSVALADVALPGAGLLRDALLVVCASVLTAIAAQIAVPVPWSPVPLTGQTFAVVLSGMLLGPRRAFFAQVLYLAEGAAGLPVFAAGAGGVARLLGPTGGYLLAFPLAAALTGALARRGWDRRFSTTFAAMLLGSAPIFALGLAWLAAFVPAKALLVSGLLPFLPGDLVKSALAALVLPAAWRRLEKPPIS
jgi:biotin transport system substrate-specific component